MTDVALQTTGEGDLRAQFRAAARAADLDPDDPWVGGYVDYERRRLPRLLAVYDIEPQGATALEFGCNVGASAVVLAGLGAQVTGVDVDAAHVRVAQANIALHALADRARALHVPDTRALPFADGTFDLAIANSVLEYVAPRQLGEVVGEIHRVMRPGATLLICGTASLLAPREVHSRAWFTNYVPRFLDPLFGQPPQRGLPPLALARATRGRFLPAETDQWLAARKAVHGRASFPVRLVDLVGRTVGIAPGWLSPNIELLLRRV
jgi:SAM-dependent methyltransferase